MTQERCAQSFKLGIGCVVNLKLLRRSLGHIWVQESRQESITCVTRTTGILNPEKTAQERDPKAPWMRCELSCDFQLNGARRHNQLSTRRWCAPKSIQHGTSEAWVIYSDVSQPWSCQHAPACSSNAGS